MLNRLIILNSNVYGKAEVRLGDCDSLQIVGPNNIGKSTLIYALNFLFIIDGKKMSFSGNRTGDKDTIHHYFPTPNNSFIIFEIEKEQTYCFVVKRDTEGDLEYYRMGHPYDENLFFETLGKQKKLLKFDEVKERISARKISFDQFRNKTEVFNAVYQRGKKNNAVVWLEENVKSDGLSNNFSKVYRYLIDSRLITNKTLKEALIIADNRENEGINFSHKSKKEINDLLRINDEIKAVRSIEEDFKKFRELVNLYNAKRTVMGEYVFAFQQKYSSSLNDAEAKSHRLGKSMEEVKIFLHEELMPKHTETLKGGGAMQNEIRHKLEELERRKRNVNEINALEGLPFLQAALSNLEQERKDAEALITRIQNQKLSSKQVEAKLDTLNENIERLDKRIKNYSGQLIHQIADTQEQKEILNYILSADIAALPEKSIKEKITKIDKVMTLFDGAITLPAKFPRKEIASIEQLKEDLHQIIKEKEEYDKLLVVVKDFEAAEGAVAELNVRIDTAKEKIVRIESLPGMLADVSEREKEIERIKKDYSKLEKDIQNLQKEIDNTNEKIGVLSEEKQKTDNHIELIRKMKLEVETIETDAVDFTTEDTIELIYEKIKVAYGEINDLKLTKSINFEKLKSKVKSTQADEALFIKNIEDELACLDDKERSIDGLLQSISTQFANPAYTLVRRYMEFHSFIKEKFNVKLSKIKISDIESLNIELVENKKIIDELKQISAIQDIGGQLSFDFDQSENLKLLNRYLDSGKKVEFQDLFDIELQLSIKGKVKTVDLKEQVESDGTDRMIRSVIIMSVINRLAIPDAQNKVVTFIDEIGTIDEGNRNELLRFCKEHNFIPISAAPLQPYDGFDKYYFLIRQKDKVNINEEYNAMRRAEVDIA